MPFMLTLKSFTFHTLELNPFATVSILPIIVAMTNLNVNMYPTSPPYFCSQTNSISQTRTTWTRWTWRRKTLEQVRGLGNSALSSSLSSFNCVSSHGPCLLWWKTWAACWNLYKTKGHVSWATRWCSSIWVDDEQLGIEQNHRVETHTGLWRFFYFGIHFHQILSPWKGWKPASSTLRMTP